MSTNKSKPDLIQATSFLLFIASATLFVLVITLFYGWRPEVTITDCNATQGQVDVDVNVFWHGRHYAYTVDCPVTKTYPSQPVSEGTLK